MNRRKFVQDSLLGVAGLSRLATPLQVRAEGSTPATGDAGANLKSHWSVRPANVFHAAFQDGIGFSFAYDGQEIGPAIPQGWEFSSATVGGVALTTFRHSSGLTVVREARPHPESEALEYTLRFRNESSSALPVLGPINALDLSFGRDVLPGVSVVSSGGGLADPVYPPATFAIQRRYIGPMTPTNGRVTLTTAGGRSSNRDLPFYFVENQEKDSGIFIGFGWSGQWRATVAGDSSAGHLRLTGEIPGINLRLQPGEEISGPRILIGCYRGPLSSGSNRLRRLIRDHYTPLVDGEKPLPILTYDHWWNVGAQFDEKLLRQLADAAAEISQEYFLLDAGWYVGTGAPSWNFSAGVGNWEEVDRAKFPLGLTAFADYVRSRGLKFGLWFEPERVAKGSLLHRQHPDWVIWLPDDAVRVGSDMQALPIDYDGGIWLPKNAVRVASLGSPSYGLLDYGKPEVQDWVLSVIDRYIRENDIRYIRYDFNLDPLAYWEGGDTPDRRGLSQIRHIEGFYRVIDWIRTHHSKTVLEGCSSGGRRIDLETTKRFHTFWISDNTADPHIVRFHTHGLNHFLPGNYLYTCYTLPLPNQKGFTSPDIAFQSFFGGEFGTGGRVDQWPQNMKDQARWHIDVYKRIRRFLVEDYYSLAPQPRDLESWVAWQFHNPKTDEGFVQVFRLESTESSKNFPLKGLDARGTYRFTDPYSGDAWQMAGAKILAEGIKFKLARLASEVLVYQKLH